MFRICLALAMLVAGVSPACAAQLTRVALVIGNGDYARAGQLRNPEHDATLVAAAFSTAGFTTVKYAANLKKPEFETALREFREVAKSADIAAIYYAGHGMEVAGKNWLIPVDATLGTSADLPYEAIDLDRMLEAISGARVRMVILDACRNNPYARNWVRTTRDQTAPGLGYTEIDDYLVLYSAAPGETASDGNGDNSPFAVSLAKRIAQPGLPLQLLGNSVRDDVLAATGGTQRPFVSSSITSQFVYLYGTQDMAADADGPRDMERLAWENAIQANTAEAYRVYKTQFPSGRFVKKANQSLKRLALVPAPAPASASSTAPDSTGGDTVLTRKLNQAVSDNNDSITRKHEADMDQYRKEVEEIAAASRSLQEGYLEKVNAFHAEEDDWRHRVAACRKTKDKCAQAATEQKTDAPPAKATTN